MTDDPITLRCVIDNLGFRHSVCLENHFTLTTWNREYIGNALRYYDWDKATGKCLDGRVKNIRLINESASLFDGLEV